MRFGLIKRLSTTLVLFSLALLGVAQGETLGGEAITIERVSSAITIDGDLSDPGWASATRLDRWFETRPGDNVEPKISSVGYLAFDDRFLYVAFEMEDPDPNAIRAPLGDRDNVPSYTDYAGIIIDPRGDGTTAQMFLANPSGIQYDAISSDASGEDSSPDFFWDCAGRLTATGWVLEIRIPFSSLRYRESDPSNWGIMLYRNYPRDFRYQMFTSRLPRDVNCFICNSRPLIGLEGLPSGGSWVAAPYAAGNSQAEPEGALGTPLGDADRSLDVGLDVKWLPNPDTVLDATINPDFSQIEADVPQIAANERFALFFPEKRPFFLEGVDLFKTPLQAVYTRTFTSPRWGLRGTGTFGSTTYTAFIGEDRGGGSVIIPHSTSSELAEQDYSSHVAVARFRHDIGRSFISLIYSGRRIDDGGSNTVIGPDFQWRPNDQDTITGQLLFSRSATPNRPDLADEWDGRELSGHAAELWWNRATGTWDYFLLYNDLDDEFRADNGFVPRVGLRRGYGELGYSFWRADKKVSRLRTFFMTDYVEDRDGRLLERHFQPGFGLDSLWSSFVRFEFGIHDVREGERLFSRNQVRSTIQFSPHRRVPFIRLLTTIGEDVDFANQRPADVFSLSLTADIRPTDHISLSLNADRRTLNTKLLTGTSGRLFTANVARVKAMYLFSPRTWVRVIGEWVETERDPSLYVSAVQERSAFYGLSAVFAYRLNWQSVVYVGYGDTHELADVDRFEPASRQIFVKLSYAFQG